jgi:hypothetical protein
LELEVSAITDLGVKCLTRHDYEPKLQKDLLSFALGIGSYGRNVEGETGCLVNFRVDPRLRKFGQPIIYEGRVPKKIDDYREYRIVI